jgi:hypothetical protein
MGYVTPTTAHHRLLDTSTSHKIPYIYNINLFIPPGDVEWFITRFEELGKPIGIKLNQQKLEVIIGPAVEHISVAILLRA